MTSPSGGGKTNLLYRMLMAPMLFYDKLYLYAKNIEQSKHKHMIDNLTDVSKQVSYDVFHHNNGDIIPVDEMDTNSQKIAIFDGFICEKKIKKYKRWLDYFIRGRQKNCFIINLSFKGFYKTPKDIRLNAVIMLFITSPLAMRET